jgi:hypothetical protein
MPVPSGSLFLLVTYLLLYLIQRLAADVTTSGSMILVGDQGN